MCEYDDDDIMLAAEILEEAILFFGKTHLNKFKTYDTLRKTYEWSAEKAREVMLKAYDLYYD